MVSEMTPITGIREAIRNPQHADVAHHFTKPDLTRYPQVIHVTRRRRLKIPDQGVAKQNNCAIVSQPFGNPFISLLRVVPQITCF
ncbi:MAG: hypothetical protein CMM07_07860 [Rhodopirellula sp.]|nr:hypothetical protein [Rhodopirellula sp.]